MKRKQEARKTLSYLIVGIILIVLYKTLDGFSNIFEWTKKLVNLLMPFVLAGLFAYIFYIPCKSIEKTYKNCRFKFLSKRARGFSVFTVYFIIIGLIFIIVNFVMPSITKSITDLASNLPTYYTKTIEYLSDLPEDSILLKLNFDSIVMNLQQINIAEQVLNLINLETIGEYIKSFVGAAGVIFDIFVIIVVSVYLLLERNEIKMFLKSFAEAVFSKDLNKKLAKYYIKTNRVFFSFISSQILDAFIVGILVSIALLILKVKYAILLGFLVGLFNIIPYLGAIAAVVIASIITVFTGGISKALLMLVVVIVLQQIDANIINPKILGSSLELSPIITIFSVTVMGAYFGVLGMFLAVPIAAMVKVLLLDFIDERIREKRLENK